MKATLKQASKILSLFEETPIEQVQALLASGLLADLRYANIALIERDSFRNFIGLKPFSPCLGLLGSVFIPMMARRFIAREHFLINTVENDRVRIAHLSENFKEWFLDKVEEPAEKKVKLRYAKLLRPSKDKSILGELGEERETTLVQIFVLMEWQKNGKEGVLSICNNSSLFYVFDKSFALRAVVINWMGVGYGVHAFATGIPKAKAWDYGLRVFFSDLSGSEV